MSLNIAIDQTATPTISLTGRLDSNTAPRLDEALDRLLAGTPMLRLVFDLSHLEYLSSAGIRCFVRARKIIEPRGGRVAVVNPQPGVRKVLDIVKAIPSGGIFKNVAELDAYLDDIQRQVQDNE
ncbi:anti-anti-sigma factor [Povalibacter uvarum]|uniref:Anti-sigma factor antagonist n=1 Tax=Povalibacter uvarum TaxID=732238 RepID=A0A841HUT1_9GAMM|nr:STAS domain-containing protein [Povalibacter uvarum]MBB6096414.1 anti-anti-sigma factor [Povalibacter uvarum]